MTNYHKHNFFCKETIKQEVKETLKNALLFVIVIVCLIWMTGCSVEVVPKSIDKAINYCERNDGLSKIYLAVDTGIVIVHCKNGAIFKIYREDYK